MGRISKNETVCPFCGHDPLEYKINQRALKPMTVLNGKYLLGRVLGEGGFGITYLGIDTTLELKVAVKEYFPVQFASRNVYESASNDITVIGGETADFYKIKLERFEEEARRLVKLEALPGIVRVLNFFYQNKTAYMVMEFVSENTLGSYIRNNRSELNWNKSLDILRPIIESLSILHRYDIIHRDISPDNILITDDKQPVLIDFGTAVEIDENDHSKEIELKRGYAPPEQYSSHGNQGPWTDVYEVCALLYYMISGSVLPDAMALYDGSKKIKPLRDYGCSVPSTIEDALMKGLNTDIRQRIKSMDELYDHLYNGRRIIPWRSIGIVSAVFAAMIAVFFITSGIISHQREEKKEYEQIGSEKDEIQDLKEDGSDRQQNADDREKEDEEKKEGIIEKVNAEGTASYYIEQNGLKYTDSSLFSYTDNDSGVTITGIDKDVQDVVIPEMIDGKPVTSIAEIVGMNLQLCSIVLPDTMTSIEASAFRNCMYLTDVFIPSSVISIGDHAFKGCSSLEEISIPSSVISIGNDVFSGCSRLSKISISDDNPVYHIEDGIIVDADGNRYN